MNDPSGASRCVQGKSWGGLTLGRSEQVDVIRHHIDRNVWRLDVEINGRCPGGRDHELNFLSSPDGRASLKDLSHRDEFTF